MKTDEMNSTKTPMLCDEQDTVTPHLLFKEQQHLTVADRDILRTASFSTHNISGEEAILLCSK